jgi:hypothetical protein
MLVVLAYAALSSASTPAGSSLVPQRPDLDTAVRVEIAGGGPADFETIALLETLAGANAGADLAEVTRRLGAPAVKQSIRILDFVVADVRRTLAARGVKMAAAPRAEEIDGAALARTLYASGQRRPRPISRQRAGGEFDPDTLLDRIVSAPVRFIVMRDVDRKFGIAAAALYRRAVTLEVRALADGDSR